MKTIEYRITYGGDDGDELVRVRARTINSGYRKALKHGLEPLGNGTRREIARIEFRQVTR